MQSSGEAEAALDRWARQDLPSDVGRGGARPRGSSEVEPALSHRARRSQPSAGLGGTSPQPSGEVEPALGHRARRGQPLAAERSGA